MTVAIVGIGQTEYGKQSGRSELQLAAEASHAAIIDAGMSADEIDGMVTFTIDNSDELELMRCLGVEELRWTARGPFGGAASAATVQLASAAIEAGMARAVLVYRAFNRRSGSRPGQPTAAAEQPDIHRSFGLDTPAKAFALWYQRYMRTYSVSNEDLGRYVVIARANAATNPAAWYHGKPITLEEHQQSRWIVEPILRLLDCCQETDGGVALVLTSAERARDCAQPAVRIAAAAQSHRRGGSIMHDYYREGVEDFAEARSLSDRLWSQSGVTAQDIDVALIYENFSPLVFMALEGHGFCGAGEAKGFIADGHIALDGALPVNTHGGLIGEAYVHGVNNLIEGVRQIRGTAANQVAGARHVLVSAVRSGAILAAMNS